MGESDVRVSCSQNPRPKRIVLVREDVPAAAIKVQIVDALSSYEGCERSCKTVSSERLKHKLKFSSPKLEFGLADDRRLSVPSCRQRSQVLPATGPLFPVRIYRFEFSALWELHFSKHNVSLTSTLIVEFLQRCLTVLYVA